MPCALGPHEPKASCIVPLPPRNLKAHGLHPTVAALPIGADWVEVP